MRPRPERLLDYREYPVLYVDDEPENLRVFELGFRREFRVNTATSGEEALRLIHEQPTAVVLSDQRMDGMSGVELLAKVREIDPKTVRVLVTAYGDVETLSEAINAGSIYRYVPKPWRPDEMRITLRNAIEVYALDREREELLHELEILNRVARSLNQELALSPLLELLLDTVTGELGYDGATLFLFDAGREQLEAVGMAPSEGEVAERLRSLAISQRRAPIFVQRVLAGQVQTVSTEGLLELEPPVRQLATEIAAEELLVLPLVARNGAVGALVVDNRRGGRRFGAADRTLLEGLAAQAVVALANARLVEDLRRSREHVRRADRLGTLGTLAAGLAHEINNPLVSVHTFLSLAPQKRHEEDPGFWDEYHALACREVARIRGLVSTMSRLGRGATTEATPGPCDAGELLDEVVTLLGREVRQGEVELEVERAPELPKLVAVRDHIHQVVLNLLLNALHATPPGGRIVLRARGEPLEGREGVCIEVADTGSGMAEEELERIFDPFYTTKGPDQGSGLGLMICHRIVTDHGGTIEVESLPGRGSTFRVRLPLEGTA